MFVEENSASIYLQGMRDRSMRSGTKFAREIQLTDWSTAGNLSNRSYGVQIPRDICTRFRRYLEVQLDNNRRYVFLLLQDHELYICIFSCFIYLESSSTSTLLDCTCEENNLFISTILNR